MMLHLAPTILCALSTLTAVPRPFTIGHTAPFHGQPCTAYSAFESFTFPDTQANPPDDPLSTTLNSAVIQTVVGGVITAQGNLDHLLQAPNYRITDVVPQDLQQVELQLSMNLNQVPWGNVVMTYLDGNGVPHALAPSTSTHMIFQMGHEERLLTWDLSQNPDTILSYRIDVPAAFSFTTLDAVKLDTRFACQPTCTPPQNYCAAKLNSLGCLPAITSSGTPSATNAQPFVVSCANVRNAKPGLLLYSVSGRASIPFQGGTLCLAAPVKRAPSVSSGGTPLPASDCTGVYALDMNAFAVGGLGGNPLPALQVVGTVVDTQWWGRDPGFAAPNNTTLSAGLEYTVCL